MRLLLRAGALALLLASFPASPAISDVVHPLPYDLLYVRAPYFGADAASPNSSWPDTVRPLTPDPGAQLVLLRRDGSREVLFPLETHRGQLDTPRGRPLAVGAVADPNVSFDGRQVVFAWYHDLTAVNPQRGSGPYLSRAGADLYKLDLATRRLVRLTTQALTPNTGNGARFTPGAPGSNHPRIGVFNTGPTWAPGGRIVFTSTRNALLPPKELSSGQRVLQLYAMDDDGANVEQIGHFNLAMALHPQVLLDGRIAFSSWEEQGVRDPRQFALWVIGPDGRDWHALSGFAEPSLAHHFMTQMPGGDLVVTRYYNLNNNGFGDLVRYPLDPPGPDFGSPDAVFEGNGLSIPFARTGQRRLTPWTTPDDFPAPCPGWEDDPYGASGIERPSPCAGVERRGKLTHPAAAPSAAGDPARADLLAVYAPGPANHNGIYESLGTAFPRYRGEIVLLPDGEPVPVPPAGQPGRPPGLVTVLAEDGFNLQWPRPVVSWSQLYGVTGPASWPEGSAAGRALGLPPGAPFGVLGSASLLWRDTAPSLGRFFADRDPFNSGSEAPFHWVRQGSDAGIYGDDDVHAVRILLQEPATDRTYPDGAPRFWAAGGERLRILGEIAVRKPNAPAVPRPPGSDTQSEPDTSFLAKVPADVALTFQTLDRRGMVLTMAQTWHQVRPGEARYDCGGCHAHSRESIDIRTTAAGRPGYRIPDLARTTPLLALDAAGAPRLRTVAAHQVTVEYQRDVAPILEARCAACHGAANPAGGLPLTRAAAAVERNGVRYPGSYTRLALDTRADFSPPPPPGEDQWWPPQLTRWVRAFQSRQSLLLWKVWGQRLDGRANADRDDDLDFEASAAHPAGVGVPGMPPEEKLTLARWVDLGAPIDLAGRGEPWGFFEDDLRPTLVVRPTVAEARAAGGFNALEIAAFDVESGVAPGSLTVTCNLRLGSFAPGANLAAGRALDPTGKVLRLTLPRKVRPAERAVFTITVRDVAGHQTVVRRTYRRASP
jgi:hypothetical protein